MYYLEMFGVSLGLTLVLELAAARILGIRGRKHMILVILVNVLTNPAAVLLCWLGIPQLPVELAVILSESLIYLWFSRDQEWNIPHPVVLAAVSNAVSWGSGWVIGGLL